ncbi:MAG: diphosphomevalonate decarboxylase, partial [Marinilabiliales bacterium]
MIKENDKTAGRICWRSPSNIALVKYWGKKKGQVPANPSVSMTLSESYTETCLGYSLAAPGDGSLARFVFEGSENEQFAGRIRNFLGSLHDLYPFMGDYKLDIESSNSFPHSSGIASSASA